MMKLLIALVVNVVAQKFGGAWGAPIAGLLLGALLPGGSGAVTAVAAPVAAGGLLGAAALSGAPLGDFAARMAGNFGLPAWAPVVAAVVLPGLQAGGMAGAVSGLKGLLRPAPGAAR
ncbi:MAG: hypothetical protein MUE41_00930 [Gemmatimonadaceae bacterium]|jgi:hypothetical protein|nr:hypothetical protein [Gemmatimonadaceae bacterium]